MITTIYMPLLDEGTDVWRPVTATALDGGRYRILSNPQDDENWAFASGVMVVVDSKLRIIAEVTP